MTKSKKFNDYIKKYLLIVDVQEGFSEFFPNNYLDSLNKLAQSMDAVYQIWDKNDYNAPDYKFPNQIKETHKYYGLNIDESLLTEESLEEYEKDSKSGFYYDSNYNPKAYYTTNGGFYIFIGMGHIGPGHQCFFVSKNLVDFFNELKTKTSDGILFLAGGAEKECLYDVEVALEYGFGINYKKLTQYTYSA